MSRNPDAKGNLSPLLAPYVTLVEFLGAMLGPDSEVVLHDVHDLDHSVVALANASVSGREIGSPATDLVLRILNNRDYQTGDYLANYLAYGSSGRAFRSSTLFIKDGDEIIGMLCINMDNERLVRARNLLDEIIATELIVPELEPMENLSVTAEDATNDSINRVVMAAGINPSRMTTGERADVIRQLNRVGVFLLKGSVALAASALEVSEATVYRHLNTMKSERVDPIQSRLVPSGLLVDVDNND
jgi:predicted transcriptional regulator YheO